jgi:glutaryl-CoA dehydrogenase
MKVPDSYRLPEATSLRAPLLCLAEARYGIIFGAVGAARDCFEVSLGYATTREQFDGPISKHQLTQAKFQIWQLKSQLRCCLPITSQI